MTRRAAPASTPSKLLADPYAWRFDRPFSLHPSMFAFGDDSGPFAPKAIAGAPPAGEPGRKRAARRRSSSMSSTCAAFLASTRRSRKARAQPSPDSRIPHRSRIWRRSASPQSRSCRLTRSSTNGICRRSASRTPGATTRWCSGHPIRVSLRRLGGCPRGDRRIACGGHRGDPRRRLQPQRRKRPVRADAVVPRPRQRDLVSTRSEQSGRLHQRYGHRQLPRARPPAGHRHGDRRAQALDDPRRLRWLSLRSRHCARPTRKGLRPACPVLRRDRRRSGP